MKILTGQHAGDGYRPRQWANDWITADAPAGGQHVVASPGNVELDDADLERFRAHHARWTEDGRTGGQFWRNWQIDGRRLTLTAEARAEIETRQAARRRRARARPAR